MIYIKEKATILPINSITGELEENVVIKTQEQIYQEKEVKRKYLERQVKTLRYKDYPLFFWLVYDNDFFNKISGATITRLFYLATYLPMQSDIISKQRSINNPIKKSQLSKILNISKRECDYFWKECTDNEILSTNNKGEIKLSKQYFSRGPLKRESIENDVIRVCIPAIRKLYQEAKPSAHKTLAYLFRLIPYVNIEYNIVCHNQTEMTLDNIECLTLGELAEVWDYDKNHLSRLKKELWKYKVERNGKLQVAISFVSDPEISNNMVFINPYLYYAGKNFEQVEVLGYFCKVKQKNTRTKNPRK